MTTAPVFTVLIPTFARADSLALALAAWNLQTPNDLPFEVVVIDDGSPDHTREVLSSFRSTRFELRRLAQSNAGPAAARNRGLRVARGQFVLFTGDDIEPTPDLLENHLLGHSQDGSSDVAILGLTQWPQSTPVTATMRHVDGVGAQQFSYHWLEDGKDYDFRHFYTSNISIQRTMLDQEPTGFSEDFPSAAFEDAEFAHRLAGWGLKIKYRASARAFHHHAYTVHSFFDRQRRCGRMAALLWEQTPSLAKWLSIRDLENLRLQAATQPAENSDILNGVACNLGSWESHALSLAGFYDHLDPCPEVQDSLLHSLFQYAYLKGLGEGLLEPQRALSAAAAAFIALIPSAALDYQKGLEFNGLPCPAEDVDRLVKLTLRG